VSTLASLRLTPRPARSHVVKGDIILPFKFDFNDPCSSIVEILKKDYSSIIRYASEQRIIFYYKDNYQIDLYFDAHEQVKSVYISLINIEEKTRLKLELELEFQRQNINPENIDRLKVFRNTLPEMDWDYQTNLGAKEVVMRIFDQFIESLSIGMLNRDPFKIYFSIEETILRLNEAQNAGLIIDTH
jgi:hypothetical protein